MHRSASNNPVLNSDQAPRLPADAAAFPSLGHDQTDGNMRSTESQPPQPVKSRGVVKNSPVYLKFCPHHFGDFSARLEPTYIEEGEDSVGVSGPHTTNLNIAQFSRLCG